MSKNMSSWFFAVFTGFSCFFAVFGPKPTIENFKNLPKNSIFPKPKNRFYAYSDSKYGFKIFLSHQLDSFNAKYHLFESFKGLLKNLNVCQKRDFYHFLGFFEIFDVRVIFRFFAQNGLKWL